MIQLISIIPIGRFGARWYKPGRSLRSAHFPEICLATAVFVVLYLPVLEAQVGTLLKFKDFSRIKMAKKKVARKRTTSEKVMIVLSVLIALSMVLALFVAFAPQTTTGSFIHLPALVNGLARTLLLF